VICWRFAAALTAALVAAAAVSDAVRVVLPVSVANVWLNSFHSHFSTIGSTLINCFFLKIIGPMHVFSEDHAPHGHMHIVFDNVRVPKDNMLLGEGRGFEISQLRLGPGRIHHCMRSIGQAEKALELLVKRGASREAFGKQLVWLGGNVEIISRARIDIEAMRLMVLKAAKAMDVLGNREARIWVHMVKAMVPQRVCEIIDQAIQMYGALGVSQKTPLAKMYASQRTLRLADGPDEVHHLVVGRHEIRAMESGLDDMSATMVWRS
jgi:acyl-CoA dehydrogenase